MEVFKVYIERIVDKVCQIYKKNKLYLCFIKYDRFVNIYIFFVYNLYENIIGKIKRFIVYKNNGSLSNCKVVVFDINIFFLKIKIDYFYCIVLFNVII